ncbi:dihydropyrimidinase [Roseburia hominis]
MLIKNGVIIGGKERVRRDIRLKDGKIATIAEELSAEEQEEVIDAAGGYILPGGVDAHTHLDMPAGECMTADDYLTGTKAAVIGGTTTVMDFAEYEEGESLKDALACWHKKAAGKAYCDYSFHMTVSGWDEHMKAQIKETKEQGITSFKAYTAYQDGIGVNDSQMFRILQCMRELGTLLCVHCENGAILEALQADLRAKDASDPGNHPKSRPNLVEKEAVSRVIDMAAIVGVPVYIVHVSTREAIEVIEQAKKRGQEVYAETCPQYLLLDESKYDLPGFESAKYVLSPPLRTVKDQEALWKALKEHRVDTVSTDHCSFRFEDQKSLGKEDFTRIPNGMPGIENRMELILTYGSRHGMSLEEIVEVTAENPAKIFGLYPEKGVIQEGSDADLIVVKEDCPHKISAANQHENVDYTPYEGVESTYQIQHVFVKGKHAVEEGKWLLEKPEGKFLTCK